MTRRLALGNRQRRRAVHLRRLRRIVLWTLSDRLRVPRFDLGIQLVAAAEMARLNESFLHHAGSTDVITFDYGDGTTGKEDGTRGIHGEIVICLDDVVAQARRYRVSWQRELVRCMVHGLLHLQGFEDARAGDRRAMKREENRLVRQAGRQFAIDDIARVGRKGR